MDFSQAALLIAAVFTVTELFKRVAPDVPAAVTQVVVIVIGIAMTFLVAYSTYANTITIGGHTLDDVNGAGLVVIGLLISGGATVTHQTLRAIKNIGQNQDAADPQA